LKHFINLITSGTKKLLNWIVRERDVFPVVIFALVPTLSFWTVNNIQELGPSLMTRVLAVALLFGLIFYVSWYFLLKKDKFKASIMAILTIIATFSYGQLFNIYQQLIDAAFENENRFDSDSSFLVVLVILYITTIYLVKNKLKPSQTLRNYIALFATILLAFNLYPLIRHWITNFGLNDTPFGANIEVVNEKTATEKPDIYYLVFDRYANEQVLKDIYNFNNSSFLDTLEDKGFYVASNSAANYPFTTFSLTTSLNLDYVPEEFRNRPESGLYYTLLKDKMENNKAVLFLKEQGYTFTNIGPWWTATKYNKNADTDLFFPTGIVLLNKKTDLKEHELLLFQDTILWPFFSKLPLTMGPHKVYGLTFTKGKESTSRVIHRQTALHQFESLTQTTQEPGPKFVFAHLLFPHDPYVLDENCNVFQERYDDEYVVYINQLKCANSKIQQTIEYILENNETEPIIIIQSDEGPYPKAFRENKELDWSKAPVELLHQKAKILNAYYFPDGNYSELYESVSPVNSFRLIFDQFLGTDLGLLEDRHYFQESEKRRFFLHDLTEKF